MSRRRTKEPFHGSFERVKIICTGGGSHTDKPSYLGWAKLVPGDDDPLTREPDWVRFDPGGPAEQYADLVLTASENFDDATGYAFSGDPGEPGDTERRQRFKLTRLCRRCSMDVPLREDHFAAALRLAAEQGWKQLDASKMG